MVKTIKKYINKKSKRSKKIKGGGFARIMQKGMMKVSGKKEGCNLAVDYLSGSEPTYYSNRKLLSKISKLKLIEEEPEYFKEVFEENVKKYCIDKKVKRNLKFCSNLLNCLKSAEKFYEVLYDTFDIDQNKLLSTSLYNFKKKTSPDLTFETFISNEKKIRSEALVGFIIDVIIKSIIQYEARYPYDPKKKSKNLKFKDNFLNLFNDMGIVFDYEQVNYDNLLSQITEKEETIKDYYEARIPPKDNTEIIKDKEKKTPTFLKVFLGIIASLVVIESGLFDSPPGVPGGIS